MIEEITRRFYQATNKIVTDENFDLFYNAKGKQPKKGLEAAIQNSFISECAGSEIHGCENSALTSAQFLKDNGLWDDYKAALKKFGVVVDPRPDLISQVKKRQLN